MTTQATVLVQWKHPTHGRIVERVCPVHERVVLHALTDLGIGCGGRALDEPVTCIRCANAHHPVRQWIGSQTL
jgi:hypothetical protein